VRQGKEAQWRPRELDAAPLKQVAEWTGKYRRFWEKSFERLDAYLLTLKEKEKSHGHGK
jgi:L-lactate utilization protein LutB